MEEEEVDEVEVDEEAPKVTLTAEEQQTFLRGLMMDSYPLVNLQKTMENHHFNG